MVVANTGVGVLEGDGLIDGVGGGVIVGLTVGETDGDGLVLGL